MAAHRQLEAQSPWQRWYRMLYLRSEQSSQQLVCRMREGTVWVYDFVCNIKIRVGRRPEERIEDFADFFGCELLLQRPLSVCRPIWMMLHDSLPARHAQQEFRFALGLYAYSTTWCTIWMNGHAEV